MHAADGAAEHGWRGSAVVAGSAADGVIEDKDADGAGSSKSQDIDPLR